MVLVAVVLVVSVLAGWLSGGRVRNLGHVELHGTWLVFTSVGLQLILGAITVLGGPGDVLGRPLLAASHLALLAFIAANRLLPGMALVFLGFALNAAVIVANGAMPVASEALEAVGGVAEVDPGKHQLLDDDTALPWLADVIPVAAIRGVVSVGDVVLAAGAGILIVGLMRRFPPAPGRRLRPRPIPPLARQRRRDG